MEIFYVLMAFVFTFVAFNSIEDKGFPETLIVSLLVGVFWPIIVAIMVIVTIFITLKDFLNRS